MSKITLHLQKIPPWWGEFVSRCQGRLQYVVGINVFPDNRSQGVETLGRTWKLDENSYVDQGAAGADAWINSNAATYAANPHVSRWIGPNEYVLWDQAAVDRFNAFHVRYIERMSSLGHGTVCGQINTGWPHLRIYPEDPPPYPESLAPTLAALYAHQGWFSLHEYWPGAIVDGKYVLTSPTGNILRYRDTRAALIQAGITNLPDFYISELGIDMQTNDPASDYGHWGWKKFVAWPTYFSMLKSYSAELDKDAYVRGASIFTVADDWVTFQINEQEAMPMADWIASDTPEPPVERARGIDISEYQNTDGVPTPIDWGAVVTSGIKFAIIRASVGASVDQYWEQNYQGAKAAGLLVGAYHYLDPVLTGQARVFARAVAGKELELGCWADIEHDDLTAVKCSTFFEYADPQIEQPIHIYTSKSKFDKYGIPSWAAGRLLWVADWRDVSEPALPLAWADEGWEFWQHTSDGAVPGIVGRVDLDVFCGTVTELQEKYGNGGEVPEVTIKVFDINGAERDWAWVVQEFGDLDVRLADAVEVDGTMQVVRLVEVREEIGPASCTIKLLNLDGAPVQSIAIAWYWPGAPIIPDTPPVTSRWEERADIGFTDAAGTVGPVMSVDGYYDPRYQIGPYGAWVLAPAHPSDGLFGLGMIAGTEHRHLNPTFQVVIVGDEPPTPPTPEDDALERIADACERIAEILAGWS